MSEPRGLSARREVGKWLFQPLETEIQGWYGIFLQSDGSVTFFDLPSFAFIGGREDADYLAYQYWIREALD